MQNAVYIILYTIAYCIIYYQHISRLDIRVGASLVVQMNKQVPGKAEW